MALVEYRKKRHFEETPEPRGGRTSRGHGAPIFVVQEHHSRSLHYDFRLQIGGVLASWSVPKGPPRKTSDKRLAIRTEDHPLEYASFEGTIPKGNYGAGTVEIWDRGTFQVENGVSAVKQLAGGMLKFTLTGKKLVGGFALIHAGRSWLFVKHREVLPNKTHGGDSAQRQ